MKGNHQDRISPKLPAKQNSGLSASTAPLPRYQNDGVYEMWGATSGKPPLNSSPAVSELGTTDPNKAFEYDDNQNHYYGSSQHLKFVEIGPSR